MTEKTRRIVEGLRYCAYCASEGAPCENCPIYEECRSLVAKLALEAIEKLMREREEREDLLDAAFRTIVELQEAQHPNWTPMSEPPKEKGFYLTSVKYRHGETEIAVLYWVDGAWGERLLGITADVVAWQPLPEPYDPRKGTMHSKWIPVTERLPKPFDMVLVTHKHESGSLYRQVAYLNHQGKWAGLAFEGEVTAWMPLPEFYKAKED
jgi:hypothetical protein